MRDDGGAPNPRVSPGLNQQELANLLGVHRVTLNKALRELEREAVLGPYSRDEVYIVDMERFSRTVFKIAKAGCCRGELFLRRRDGIPHRKIAPDRSDPGRLILDWG